MTDSKPMPRAAIVAAGCLIALSAAAGLGVGIARDLKLGGGGGDPEQGIAVAPIKAANAQALVAPPVTEPSRRRRRSCPVSR